MSLIGSQNVEHSIIWKKKEHKVKVIEDTYKVWALIECKGNLQSNMKMGYLPLAQPKQLWESGNIHHMDCLNWEKFFNKLWTSLPEYGLWNYET